jgi:hypothetical protein
VLVRMGLQSYSEDDLHRLIVLDQRLPEHTIVVTGVRPAGRLPLVRPHAGRYRLPVRETPCGARAGRLPATRRVVPVGGA